MTVPASPPSADTVAGTFARAGGADLHWRSWRATGEPRATVIVVHGFGEHGGRYGNLGSCLSAAGLAVYAYDQRGHGRSPGQRGHIQAWSDYRDDLAAFAGWLRANEAARPTFFYGHSMGALVVLDYAIRRADERAGLVLSAPPLRPGDVAGPLKVAAARLLSRLVPRCPLALRLDPAGLSRDPRVVEAYREDPLVHGRASARWGGETLAATEWLRANADVVSDRFLLIHGDADPIARVEGSREFFRSASVADRTLRVYPGVYHEAHNDLGHEVRLREVADWILERTT